MLSKWRRRRLQESLCLNFDQRTSDMGDPSNELHLVDKMNAKSDI